VITIETDTVLTIRRRSSIRAWCPGCGRQTDFVRDDVRIRSAADVNKIALIAGIGADHRITAKDGSKMVCLNSALGLFLGPEPPQPKDPRP